MEIDTFQDAIMSKLIAKFYFIVSFILVRFTVFHFLINFLALSIYVCFFLIRIDKLSLMVKTYWSQTGLGFLL